MAVRYRIVRNRRDQDSFGIDLQPGLLGVTESGSKGIHVLVGATPEDVSEDADRDLGAQV
jgi:hypothetical protein